MYPVVFQGLPRIDSPYATAAVTIAKGLSNFRPVLYVEHPHTWKDRWNAKGKSDIAEGVFQPFSDKPQFYVLRPKAVPPYNSLAPGRFFEWIRHWINRVIWKQIDAFLEKNQWEKIYYVNSFDPVLSLVSSKKTVLSKLYHSVDLMSGEAWIARHGVKAEQDCVETFSTTVATSIPLMDRLSAFSNRVLCIPNGVDSALFGTEQPVPPEMEAIPEPRILYTGNIGLRIDYVLLESLADARPHWHFVFVGPKDKRYFGGQALETRKNVHFLGGHPLEQLPGFLRGANACIIPFEHSDLTSTIYPLKINEYLAAGKPVVTTRFTNLSAFNEVVRMADSPENFVAELEQAMKETSDESVMNRKLVAASNDWNVRIAAWNALFDPLETQS